MNLIAGVSFMLTAPYGLAQGAPPDQTLAKFGLKPNIVVAATNGKATLAEGETIEFVGACDLADPVETVWNMSGQLLDAKGVTRFWDVMNIPPQVRTTYGLDEEKRTFAMAFQLSKNLTRAHNLREDVDKTFALMLSQTRPASGEGNNAYVGEARIIRPILPSDYTGTTFDFRLEVPGGEWVTIAEFPFGPDTNLADGLVEVKQRWQGHNDFKMIDGHQEIVDYKGYYFTVTLPKALREMELEIVTNDPAVDAKYLPEVTRQHIRGEDQGKGFEGKDLFIVYGLTSRSETRKFSLRARPKRTVEFNGIPFKRG